MALLNIRRLVPPSFTSMRGTNSPYDFPLNTMAALEARKQGGFVTYVHPMSDVRDVFDTWLGAKEAPVTAAWGALDAIDILPFGEPAYELWYRFLNSGFKIQPGAGTDVFGNIRGLNQVPGGVREYVHLAEAFSLERWMARYREGRVFVTSGPLLTLQANGEPIGAEIQAPSGRAYQVHIMTEVSSRVPIGRIEILQNGFVIESRELPADTRNFRMEKDISVSSSSWFAVRVSGPPARGIGGSGWIPRAHSGPIYVKIDGAPVLIKEDLALMIRWVDRLWALLEERDNFGPGDNKARAREMIAQAREHYVKKLAASY